MWPSPESDSQVCRLNICLWSTSKWKQKHWRLVRSFPITSLQARRLHQSFCRNRLYSGSQIFKLAQTNVVAPFASVELCQLLPVNNLAPEWGVSPDCHLNDSNVNQESLNLNYWSYTDGDFVQMRRGSGPQNSILLSMPKWQWHFILTGFLIVGKKTLCYSIRTTLYNHIQPWEQKILQLMQPRHPFLLLICHILCVSMILHIPLYCSNGLAAF